ncbi:hypothetical protein QBZ16_004157 [Prototheca wickerhamii]|uniref:Uncharacterized protein n=1 Tax=Prototheca wickerhamii TaxID=3111 RepID=A0AAD9MLK1_PROWI|nr:hypothetical protein QBZ16_004157 [Prototheca wickerhamii]
MYAKVTDEDIESFEETYRGSEEEKRDVFEWVMCSDPKRDSHRFADLVREHLQREGSEPPARFVKWEKQVRKRRAPADPLAPRKRGKENRAGGQDDASLVALIRWVDEGGGFLDSLAAKYGVDHAAGGPEPSEEAFAATAKRMKGRGKPKK